MRKLIGLGIGLLSVLIIGGIGFLITWERIDNGFVGVRYSMSDGIRDEALSPGFKYVGLDKVTQYPVRLQTVKAKNIRISTSDGKQAAVNIKYDYRVDTKKVTDVYKEFGNISSEDIENGWLKSKLQSVARDAYSNFSILDVLTGKSDRVQNEILENLKTVAKEKGFEVEGVTVEVPDVDEKTKEKIDSIIQAGQDNEKAILEAKTAKTRADSKAYEKVTAAEAEAEANKKVAASISNELIEWRKAEGIAKYGNLKTISDGSVITDDK